MKPSHLFASQNLAGEGPLWRAEEQALYWVDIDRKKIQRYTLETMEYEVFDLPYKISFLAFRSRGGMVLGTDNGLYFWDHATGKLDQIADPEKGKSSARFNDGKVDRKGRLWAGTMTREGATSALYRLDADLSIRKMETDITISNGIGWSPDNKTMYYVDSLRYVVYAYDFDLESGAISNRRAFVQENKHFGIPDGLTVDAEGCVWVAVYGGWKVMRYDPSGKTLKKIQFPVARTSSCTFGGKKFDQLFVTTMSEHLSETEKKEQPMAGDLFVVQTTVKGLPETDFAG